uniref:Macaca fascicularis brain cDNA clone: QorA-11893, similar to human hypothetical protein BC007436 (LOC91272), mRNA, RefSeq: NM_138369.1 n=1 Tax=Macaca fascicularis TaxID=9541 RepID=I7G3C4_MACFA|nr:unnamed protein product [Macaca fascicularis]
MADGGGGGGTGAVGGGGAGQASAGAATGATGASGGRWPHQPGLAATRRPAAHRSHRGAAQEPGPF